MKTASRSTPEWRAYHRAYYQKRKERLTRKTSRWTVGRRGENQAVILAFLLGHPCVDCGEPDPVVLEFDHVSGQKRGAVCTLARNGCSRETLLEEIGKCLVRCANCHRRRTATSRRYYRTKPREAGVRVAQIESDLRSVS